MLLHICTPAEWDECSSGVFYQPRAFPYDGFIHCCLERQLEGVLARYFPGQQNLRLLKIDDTKVKQEIKFERGPNGDDFPHVYGPISKEAIITVEVLNGD
jgi:uncharacterized protein (DUF952 family)